jgi:hypothetical protein
MMMQWRCLPWYVSTRPNARPEHEVKVQRWRKVIAADRSLDTVFDKQLAKLLTRIVIQLKINKLKPTLMLKREGE